jgi:hypothetical protein
MREMTFHRCFVLLSAMAVAAGLMTAQPPKKADSPDLKEIREYRLNLDVVQRFAQSFKTINADGAAKKCFENDAPGNAPSLDAGEKLIMACPPAVADLKKAGLKPREFLIVTASLLGGFMAVGMKKSGTIKEYPDSISPENAAFIEQNYDKLQKVLAPVMADDK